MAALGRTYYFCMGFRVVVKGKQVSSSEAPILAVAPHSTFFDGIVCIVAGLPSTVSRVENLATPIFGSETLFIQYFASVRETRGICAHVCALFLSQLMVYMCVCMCEMVIQKSMSVYLNLTLQFHAVHVDCFLITEGL